MTEQEIRRDQQQRMCASLHQWASLMSASLPIDESDPEWFVNLKKEMNEEKQRFRDAWSIVSLAIDKSCLLDRLIYGGESVRTRECPVHKGHWAGITTTPCECDHRYGEHTGWLPNEGEGISF